jgi:hypothetical protein
MASVGRQPKGQAKRVDTNEITAPKPTPMTGSPANSITSEKETGFDPPIANTITAAKEN